MAAMALAETATNANTQDRLLRQGGGWRKAMQYDERMRIILHAGFPKTGSTALQKWMAQNTDELSRAGIIYPHQGRDQEGLGHHDLNISAQKSPESLASTIAEIAKAQRDDQNLIFFSCEGISNCLAEPQLKGFEFFVALHETLRSASIDITFLLTLRRIDSYLKSILIQNIIYDGSSLKPSEFVEHQLYGIANAYASLDLLCEHSYFKLLEHGPSVNKIIIDHLYEMAGSNRNQQITIGREHQSTSDEKVFFFMWLNCRQAAIVPDFYSYLLFGNSSTELLCGHYNTRIQSFLMQQNYIQSWRPAMSLLDAVKLIGKQTLQICHKNSGKTNEMAAFLEGFLGRSLILTNLSFLPLYDMLDIYTKAKENQSELESLFVTLVEKGSIEYGQDFSKTCSLS